MKSTNHLDSHGKELYLSALMSPYISRLCHCTAMKNTHRLKGHHANKQELAVWSLTCQPCLCWCLHSWLHGQEFPKELLGSPMGPGQNISLQESESSQHSRTALSPHNCTHSEHVLVTVALFIIQLLHMLVTPSCSRKHCFLNCTNLVWLTCRFPIVERAVIQQLFELSSSHKLRRHSALLQLSVNIQIAFQHTMSTHVLKNICEQILFGSFCKKPQDGDWIRRKQVTLLKKTDQL